MVESVVAKQIEQVVVNDDPQREVVQCKVSTCNLGFLYMRA